MEQKKFNKNQIAAIKSVAKIVSKNTQNKERILKKMAELQEQLELEQKCIDGYQTPIREMTGGYTTEDLVDRITEKTGKFDANGKEVTNTKFVLKYPETVVPPVPEPMADSVTEEPTEPAAAIDPFAGIQ